MTNERLREALHSSGLTVRQVAEDLDVDPKTVERWITQSRLPYPRHRYRLAASLGTEESYLWPHDSAETPRPHLGDAEVVHVYPHRSTVPLELWRGLLEDATTRIDLLAYAGLFLLEQHPDLLALLREKADAGVRIRLLLADPECEAVAERGREEGIGDAVAAKVLSALVLYAALSGHPRIGVRLHQTTLYTSIYQFDDQMIVNPHVYGLLAAYAPALHLRRTGPGGIFETYICSLERVWQNAVPAWDRTE